MLAAWARRQPGVADAWLWRPGTRPHWVVVDHGQSLWELDPGKERTYLLLGAAHDRPARGWTGKDLHLYAQHEPPCVGDTLLRRKLPLNTIGLTAGGLVIPDSVHREISNARTGVRDQAERARAAIARRTRPRMPTARPRELACKTCGLPLDPILARIGRHIGC